MYKNTLRAGRPYLILTHDAYSRTSNTANNSLLIVYEFITVFEIT